MTFVEAMRKGQVRQDMGSVPSTPLDKFDREQGWAIPGLDFGPQFNVVQGD